MFVEEGDSVSIWDKGLVPWCVFMSEQMKDEKKEFYAAWSLRAELLLNSVEWCRYVLLTAPDTVAVEHRKSLRDNLSKLAQNSSQLRLPCVQVLHLLGDTSLTPCDQDVKVVLEACSSALSQDEFFLSKSGKWVVLWLLVAVAHQDPDALLTFLCEVELLALLTWDDPRLTSSFPSNVGHPIERNARKVVDTLFEYLRAYPNNLRNAIKAMCS